MLYVLEVIFYKGVVTFDISNSFLNSSFCMKDINSDCFIDVMFSTVVLASVLYSRSPILFYDSKEDGMAFNKEGYIILIFSIYVLI